MSLRLRILIAVAAVAVLFAVPWIGIPLPPLFGEALGSPGTLTLLAGCFVFGALAVSYDMLFGYTGLLSFGHALYFAVGVYGTAIALQRWHWSLAAALGFVVVFSIVLPAIVGAICLRTKDIAFAMVTLAFAQAGSIVVLQDPFNVTGGEEGLALSSNVLPAAFAGVVNSRNLYWLSLALLVIVVLIATLLVNSRMGRLWQAIRENETRASMVGINTYLCKLGAFVSSSLLASLCGIVYLFVEGGAAPEVTTANFTLALLVMVVLGGVGTIWGAVLGGIVYEYLDFRLVVLSSADALNTLPPILRVPLSQPLFVLGVIFIILVLFVPGGLAGLSTRFRRKHST